MTIPVAIFGGPGSGAVAAQSVHALARQGGVEIFGFLNDVLPAGDMVSGVRVIGPFASWGALPENVRFLAPLHQVKAMPERAAIVAGLGIPAQRWITIIDPMSAVAPDAIIGHGCFIGPFASIGPGARLGAHTAVRAGAHVGHDCRIGDFVFVGTNAVVCGYGTIDDGAYVAPGATVGDRCSIGKFAVVGLGSVVTKNVPDFQTVYGVPASEQ